jgi:hypothetical protein
MSKVGVQRATELTGKSKSTIQRAMKTGKLSYDVDGARKLIDVSELERVFGIISDAMTRGDAANNNVSMPSYEAELQKAKHALDIDRLEMKIKMLEDQLETAHNQIDDLKAQRDSWQKQAQQVLLTSEYSQKQAEDRIAELQKREDARMQAMEVKRQREIMRQKQMITGKNNTSVAQNNNSLFKVLFTKQKKSA